jgi:hypothetical protein
MSERTEMIAKTANHVNKNKSTKREMNEKVDNKEDKRKTARIINRNNAKEKKTEIEKINKEREDHALAPKSRHTLIKASIRRT